MKKILFACVIAFSSIQIQAQDCGYPSVQKHLHGNDIKVFFINSGGMLRKQNHELGFAVPYQTGQTPANTIATSSLWLSGYDSNYNLMAAVHLYDSWDTDYSRGPLDANGNPAYCNDFDYIWQVKRWEIEAHLQDFNDNGVINNTVPLNILKWAGKGNPQFAALMGYSLPNQDLAPFFDRNNNGLYEPLMGDYPVFEHGNATAISEDMLWYVFNDSYFHRLTSGSKLKMEIQVTAYSFYCEDDSLINRTIFVKNKIINRNPQTIYNFRSGIFTDFEIGCSEDDAAGSIPNFNTVYGYNLDNDDDTLCGGNPTAVYGINPPVQAVTILNQNMTSSIIYIPPTPGNSVGPLRFDRLLNGIWENGTPLTYGGYGYNPNDTNAVISNFIFPDNPNDTSGWSEPTSNTNAGNALTRIVASVSQDSFPSGGVFQLDIAYSYHRNNNYTNLQNVNLMYQQIPIIQQFYDNGHQLACTRKEICSNDCVYPGDMNNNGIASDFDLLTYGVKVGQNASVTSRTTPTDDWWPYDLPLPNTNGYVDANGDGSIDHADWDVNTQNFNNTHPAYTGATEGFNTVGNDLFFSRYYSPNPNLHLTPIVNVNSFAIVYVHLGDTNQTLSNIYGLTFRIDYDETVLQLIPNFLSAFFLDNGWINGETRQINEPGRIHYVNVRTDGIDTVGGSNFGRLAFRVLSTTPFTQQIMNTELCFSDFQAIDENGNNIPIGAQCITIQYQDTNFVSVIPIENEDLYPISVYPNPSTGILDIEQSNNADIQILVLDHLGRILITKQSNEVITELNISDLPSGIYYVNVNNGKAVRTEKVVKW